MKPEHWEFIGTVFIFCVVGTFIYLSVNYALHIDRLNYTQRND